jgi:Na+/H+ antiporter NhaD/arsenite permease-like protein
MRRERLLTFLLLSLPLLAWLTATPIQSLPSLVHWHTIIALTGLMILSSAIQWSGMVNFVARRLLRSVHSERLLALSLCLLAAALAAVITNDVALFLAIPLTLALARIARLPIARLVIFQALAVNAGSALSPIGNPQNIFLWQTSEVGFFTYTLAMLPIALPFMIVLGAGVLLAFHARPLTFEALPESSEGVDRYLFWPTLGFYPFFLFALDRGQGWIATAILIVIYAVWQKRRLLEVDWALLLLFVFMFTHLGMLTRLSQMLLLADWLLNLPGSELIAGILLSQIISNVPATILLEPFSSDWQRLAWGVNMGGFGLAIGSLANLIALRLARQPGLMLQFHLWSVPCLLLTILLVMLTL